MPSLHYRQRRRRWQWTVVVGSAIVGALIVGSAQAAMQSTHYRINADVISAGGAATTSAHYTVADTVGETVSVTPSASTTYVLKDGFWQMVNTTIAFTVTPLFVDFGTLIPGTPQDATQTLTVTTDAWNGYSVSITKTHRLRHTNGSDEIPDIPATIAAPQPWGTRGLGFTVQSGTQVSAAWGNGTRYAAIPTGTATVFHTKTGYRSGPDVTTIGLRVDAPDAQRSGVYATEVTYTAMATL